MKLSPPSKQPMRVHELAKELSWPSSHLVAELRRRGEYVKSPMSTVEAPVVRDIRRDFATVADVPNPDATLAPAMYGSSAERETEVDPDATFAVALAEARSKARQKGPGSSPQCGGQQFSQAILDEVIVPRRLEHLDEPRSGYFRWEVKQAEELNRQWAEARLNGLSGDDASVIKWIRLSDGQRPEIAADLSRGGIAPEEAGLHIGYGGRTGARWSGIYERYRDRRLSLSDVIVAVRQWHAAG